MEQLKGKASEIISKAVKTKSKSKRTTFKLRSQSLEALDWLSKNLDSSAKDVLELVVTEGEIFNMVIQVAQKEKQKTPKDSVRKSFVISSKALASLNMASKKNNVSRDSILDFLLLGYKNLVKEIQEKERESETAALEIMREFMLEAEKNYFQKLRKVLSDDNPILDRFGAITIIIENLYSAIQAKLDEGTPIDPNDL